MDYAAIKNLTLKVFLGFLGLTAIVAIISVLSGEFGQLQEKILATYFTVYATSAQVPEPVSGLLVSEFWTLALLGGGIDLAEGKWVTSDFSLAIVNDGIARQ